MLRRLVLRCYGSVEHKEQRKIFPACPVIMYVGVTRVRNVDVNWEQQETSDCVPAVSLQVDATDVLIVDTLQGENS